MIQYHPKIKLPLYAEEHYTGIYPLVKPRLDMLNEFLNAKISGIKITAARNLELDKAFRNSKSTESALMYRLSKKYIDDNQSVNDFFQDIASDFTHSKFIDLVSFISNNLKEIITSEPKKLLDISITRNRIICQQDKWTNYSKYKEILVWLLPYKTFRSPDNSQVWSAAKLAALLNSPVCLYCNRTHIPNYVSSKENSNGIEKFTGQFDHFYEKKEHPLIRLSFYNLVPSCTLCNTTLKTSIDTTTEPLVHPFLTGFDQKKPPVKFVVPNFKTNQNDFDIELSLQEDDLEANNSNTVFQLEDLYKNYKNKVKDLDIKMTILGNDSIKSLQNSLPPSVKVKLSQRDCYRALFGTSLNKTQYQQEPLSKFNHDILESLGFCFD